MHKSFPRIAVEAENLACRRGGRLVFTDLSFRAEAGKLLAVTGPNGSGKSSLLRILAGLLRPEAGTLRVEGMSEEEPATHYLGHADALKPALTLRETLRFWAALYSGGHAGETPAAEAVGLAHALDLPADVLSAGQRRRAGLARLLIAPRPVWLLDEPTAALDRDGEALVGRLIEGHLAADGLAIAATHQALPVAPHAVLDLAQAA
jgi:heme exporter protein A